MRYAKKELNRISIKKVTIEVLIAELLMLIAAKPIDLLAKYISAEEEVDAVEMHEPYTYLNGLMVKDLEDLIEDIKVELKIIMFVVCERLVNMLTYCTCV